MVWSPDYLGSPGKMVLSNPLTCTNTPKGDNKLYSDAKGVVPSLDLRFAEGKNLNDYVSATPLVDHQRSMSGANLSPGTFVNSSGLIETTKVNLLARSQEFNESNWVKAAGGVAAVPSVTANAEIAPDGTLTADRVVFSLNGGTSLSDISDLRQTVVTGTGTYTVSFYIRSFDGTSSYSFLLRDGDGLVSLFNVTGSWQRIEVSSPNYLAGSKFIGFVLRGGTGTSSSADILVWGAQLEEGTTATTYIPTTTSASAAPRFDHDPTTGESLGLLIEESRTNSYKFSNDFTQSNYGSIVGNIPSPAYPGPGGATSATLIIPSGGNSAYNFGRSDAGTGPVIQTASIYAKAAGYTALGFNTITGGYVNDLTIFNLSTGTVFSAQPNSAGAYMEPVGDGWYRCVIPSSVAYSGAAGTQIISWYVIDQPSTGFGSYTPNGTDGIYVYGAQLEQGSFPTSYIPTTGTALTRSADVAEITGANFSSWYNQSEGTIFHDGRYIGDVPGNLYGLGNGLIFYFRNTALDLFLYQWSLGIYKGAGISNPPNHSSALYNGTTGVFLNVADQLANNPVGSRMKSVGFINTSTGEFGHVLNGGTIRSNSANNIPIWNKVSLSAGYNNQARCGTIARFTYFPERLPDSSLQTMTTP
jgi:hypothetical protein